MKKTDLFNFLKGNKEFSKLWVSQLLSQITLNMINFVMATRIYEKTGSTIAVSFLWIFYYLPSILFGPFSGLVVDIVGRRKMLILTNLLQGVTILLYLFIGDKIYPIYPIVFLYSFLNQFYFPAEASAVPWLVQKKDLAMANSIFMLSSQTSLIFGFGLSGIIMRIFGKNMPIIISSLGLFAAAITTYFIPKNEPKFRIKSPNFANYWNQLKTGYIFIKNNRIILFPLIITIGFQVFLVVMGVAAPSISSKLLGMKVADTGPALIVPLGIGALFGATLVTRFFKERKKNLIQKGLFFSFIVFILMSLVLPTLGRYKTIFAMPLMVLLGICAYFIIIPTQTLIQENTPQNLRGRVYGTMGFLITATTLPVLLFAATIVDLLGIKLFLFLMSIILFSVFFVVKTKGQAIISNMNNGN